MASSSQAETLAAVEAKLARQLAAEILGVDRAEEIAALGGDALPFQRYPDIYSRFIYDLTIPGQPSLPQMTRDERIYALTDGPNLVWGDPNTDSQAATLLTGGFNQGYVEMYAPATVEPGSSISHWDTSLTPDQIMEPYATRRKDVVNGIGMASCVLENIGWQLASGVRCPDVGSAAQVGVADPVGAPSSGSGHSGGGGGGGGCTVDPDARFDPLWIVLLGLTLGVLTVRRRVRMR